MNKICKINSINNFKECIQKYNSNGVIFRGVSDKDSHNNLIPQFCRDYIITEYPPEKLFREFIREIKKKMNYPAASCGVSKIEE